MAFFLLDLAGVILTSLTDSLMYGAKDGAMTNVLSGVSTVAIPLIVVANVVAGFIYHMTSPRTKAMREERAAEAEHRRKMGEIAAMERDLLYAEAYLLAKQDTLDKAVLLAEIKKSQDAVEKSTRDSLRDQVGIRTAATSKAGEKMDELKARLAEMKKKLTAPKTDETPAPETGQSPVPHENLVPILQIPPADLIRFPSQISCNLGGQTVQAGDELTAKKNADRFDIGRPNAPHAFANVTEEDFNVLRNGLPLIPEMVLVKGNGHGKTDPI
jgi:hypothetical protein